MSLKIKKIAAWGIPLILFGWFIYVGTKKTIENNQLKKEGKCTKAYVLFKKRVGSKGVVNTTYQFNYKGNTYYGDSQHDDQSKVGDSIQIVFSESNPEINRSNSFLKKECPRSPEAVK